MHLETASVTPQEQLDSVLVTGETVTDMEHNDFTVIIKLAMEASIVKVYTLNYY